MQKYQNWVLASPDKDKVNKLAAELAINPIVATLLVNRRINQLEAARQYLVERWNGETPALDGCDEAVRLLLEAYDLKQAVIVYGDYDVDGICSTAIMYECLKYMGFQVAYRLPNRFIEGYGLTEEVVTDMAREGYKILLTVDCGISADHEVEAAHRLGMKTIITDHHQPGEHLPPAEVVINPRINPQMSGQELCGAGVAFCLAMALLRSQGEAAYSQRWLDLLALAVVADIVPLTGYNRQWVKEGLQQIPGRIGLKKLLAAARMGDRELSTYHIGFIIAPRLNAAGRLDNAEPALRLLLTEDEDEAETLAQELNDLNSQRQGVEEQIFQDAIRMVDACGDQLPEVLVLANDGWHQGVVGIVASRVAQRYQRPAILISWGEKLGKGSARSIAGFDIMEALRQSAATLEHFGGHQGAAGVEVSRDNYVSFCQQINQAAADCYFDPSAAATLFIDCPLPASSLTLELGELGGRLRPFGEGNPAPVFQTNVRFDRVTRIGKSSEHFKGWVSNADQVEVIFFREGMLADEIDLQSRYDIAYTPEINEFNGRRTLSLKLLDIRPQVIRRPTVSWKPRFVGGAPDDRPVLITCPDQRVLERLWPYYREIYGARAVALCGRALNGTRAQEMLIRGENRIFLTTPVYFPYHIKKFGSPKRWAVWLPVSRDAYQDAFFGLLTAHLLKAQTVEADDWVNTDTAREREAVYSSGQLLMTFDNSRDIINENRVASRAERMELRQQWIENGGTLITSGDILNTQPFGLARLVLADAPVSRGEWTLLNNYFQPAQTLTVFSPPEVEHNFSYYNSRYPDAAIIESVLKYLAARVNGKHLYNREQLADEISSALGRTINSKLLAAALAILHQTGVLQANIGPENLSINLINRSGQVRLTDSLLYLEGKWELQEWLHWESDLRQLANTGGDKRWNQMN
ncbi:MAG: single-stranded-DNA-specific exonuclease RecJ [Methylocystaceae bacterium]